MSPAPVDPYPNFIGLTVIDAGQMNARFQPLYDGLDKSAAGGLDGASFKDGAITAAKFPALQAWQSLTLSGGGITWGAALAYFKDPVGIVRVRSNLISVSGSTPTNGLLVGTFPAGYRPGYLVHIHRSQVIGPNGAGLNTPTAATVDTDGSMRLVVGAAEGTLSGYPNMIFHGQWRAEN